MPISPKLILRLLEKDRNNRPATAAEVVRLLTRIESDLDAKAEQDDATIEYSTPSGQTVIESAAAPPADPPTTGNGGDDDDNAPQPAPPAPRPATDSSWNRITKTFAVMAAVLLVPSLVYLAGTAIFRLTTPDGILVIEVDDPKGVVVEIDGETMKVKFTPDGKSIELSVGSGRRRLTIKNRRRHDPENERRPDHRNRCGEYAEDSGVARETERAAWHGDRSKRIHLAQRPTRPRVLPQRTITWKFRP